MKCFYFIMKKSPTLCHWSFQTILCKHIEEHNDHVPRLVELCCVTWILIFFIYKILWNKKFGNWVKTWSITWIFHFLMTQYEDFRWIDHFRITCKFVEQLIAKLKYFVEKKIITYKCAILVNIYVVCSFYKLADGVKYLHYSELFAIEKSTIHVILRKYVCFVN
jgi:hypothetical protein